MNKSTLRMPVTPSWIRDKNAAGFVLAFTAASVLALACLYLLAMRVTAVAEESQTEYWREASFWLIFATAIGAALTGYLANRYYIALMKSLKDLKPDPAPEPDYETVPKTLRRRNASANATGFFTLMSFFWILGWTIGTIRAYVGFDAEDVANMRQTAFVVLAIVAAMAISRFCLVFYDFRYRALLLQANAHYRAKRYPFHGLEVLTVGEYEIEQGTLIKHKPSAETVEDAMKEFLGETVIVFETAGGGESRRLMHRIDTSRVFREEPAPEQPDTVYFPDAIVDEKGRLKGFGPTAVILALGGLYDRLRIWNHRPVSKEHASTMASLRNY